VTETENIVNRVSVYAAMFTCVCACVVVEKRLQLLKRFI